MTANRDQFADAIRDSLHERPWHTSPPRQGWLSRIWRLADPARKDASGDTASAA